jgi:hypothetical protein
LISNPDEICDTWKMYFKNLYTPKAREHFNDEFKDYVDECVDNMLRKSYEVSSTVLNLK